LRDALALFDFTHHLFKQCAILKKELLRFIEGNWGW
jgi:hypothetical protein